MLPAELLIWGRALDYAFEDSYLARRVLMSPFFELPASLLWVVAVIGALCMIRAFFAICKESRAFDALLYSGFSLFMAALFLLFRMPVAAALGIPLVILGSIAAWFAYRHPDRLPFLIPRDDRRPSFYERLLAAFQLLPVICGACLLFQDGYLLWLSFRFTPLLILTPFLGCLLPTREKLRSFVSGSVYGLILCGIVFGVMSLFAEGILLLDLCICMAFLFLEVEVALILREILPKIRNISLVILLLSVAATPFLIPPICSPWIISLSMYMMYLFIDNRSAIRKKLLSRAHFSSPDIRFITREEYAAQAWGFGAMLVAWLAGTQGILVVIGAVAAVFAGAMWRTWILCREEDHLFLNNFPYALETGALLLAVVSFSGSRTAAMVMLAACACAAPMMRAIWQTGALISKFGEERPTALFYLALANTGLFFLLLVMYLSRVTPAILIGTYFMLAGILRIGAASYIREGGELKRAFGWVLIVIGQFISVVPPEAPLPGPQWSNGAVICGVIAFAALYLFRTFDFRNRSSQGSEKI
ncbi:MAG: hypothetical protein BWY31_01872 [Lentisphaerae bacterium ADurb.Bin242]|nr:MAG: hypothetical protein BWY31_01872 [Lentisphaerae bacterium ADurb.Bin242]